MNFALLRFLLFTIAIGSFSNVYAQGGWLNKIKDKAEQKAKQLQDRAEQSLENKSTELFRERIDNIRTSYDTATFGYAIAFTDQAELYEERSGFQKAQRFFVKLSDEIGVTEEQSQDPLSRAKDFYDLGELALNAKSYAKAENYFIKSEQEFQSLSQTEHPLYPKLINSLGLLYYTTGRYQEAKEYNQKALDISKEYNIKSYWAAQNNKALLSKDEGKYSEAEALLYQLESELSAQNDPVAKAIVLNNQAILFQQLGRYQVADEQLREAISIAKTSLKPKSNTFQRLLVNQAILYQQMKRYSEAKELFESAIKLKENRLGTRNHPDLAHMLVALANLHLDTGEDDKVEDLLLEAERIYEKKLGSESNAYANTSKYLGIFYRKGNQLNKSEKYLVSAHQIKEKIFGQSHPQTISCREELAVLYWKKNEIDKSIYLFDNVLENNYQFMQSYFPAMSETEKERYWDKIRPSFLKFYSFAYQNLDTHPDLSQKLYKVHLATKGILFSATTQIKKSIQNSPNIALRTAYEQWLENREKLVHLYSYSKEELSSEQINRDSLEVVTNQLEKLISNTVPELFAETEFKTYQDIRNKLPQESTFVDIVTFPEYKDDKFGEQQYIAFIGNPSLKNPKIVLIGTGKKMKKDHFNYHRNVMQMQIEDEQSYDIYWKPIAEHLDGVESVFVTLDGVYQHINLNTLMLDDGSYLIDHFNLIHLNSMKDLLKENSDAESKKNIYLLGFPNYGNKGTIVPLKGTKSEVLAIQKMLFNNDWETKLVMQNEATEDNLKEVNSPLVLHIATHGFFIQDEVIAAENSRAFGINTQLIRQNPFLRSGLMLKDAEEAIQKSKKTFDTQQNENGILTAYEVKGLNLERTQLVVLSACETGLGDIKDGEGVYGLKRAFQIAGAKSTITSLWQVSDEATQKLMTSFYSKFSKGKGIQAAFREAQQELKKDYPEPYFWGAFILTGLPD